MNLMKTVVAAAVALGAASVMAAPILDNNMRPKPINNASGETDIQTILNSNLGGVNKATGQSAAGIWGSATGSPLSTIPTLLLEQTSGASTQMFGIWFGTDTTNLLEYDLILGSSTSGNPGAAASLFISGNTMFVGGFTGFCGTAINCTGVSGITDARISTGNFGFYFRSGNTTGYSLDMINGETRFMSYTDGATNWIFGFEDGGDNDFNDMVVKVESLNRVSAPGTIALMGLGLLGIGALRRRSAT